MGDWVSIARIVKTRGIRGEVVAQLLTDFPDRFSALRRLQVAAPEGTFQVILEDFWMQKGRIVLKFEGLNRPHEVQHLVGGLVQIPEALRVKLPEETFYHDQLVGCSVIDSGRPLGVVGQVLEIAPLEGHLIVELPSGGEVIVPLVREFIRDVDLDSRTIQVELPPGLVEANQPAGRKRTKKRP